MDAPTLRRGFFGYSRKSVRGLLSEREVALTRASVEARDSEARATELAAELDRASREASGLEETRNALRSELADERDRVRILEEAIAARALPTAPGGPPTSQELIEILDAAERSLTRLTDAARRNAEHELDETQGAREELHAEIERLTAWRERMIPLVEAVRKSIDEANATTAALVGGLSQLVELPSPSATAEEAESPATEPATEPLIQLEEIEESEPEVAASPRVDVGAAWSAEGSWRQSEG